MLLGRENPRSLQLTGKVGLQTLIDSQSASETDWRLRPESGTIKKLSAGHWDPSNQVGIAQAPIQLRRRNLGMLEVARLAQPIKLPAFHWRAGLKAERPRELKGKLNKMATKPCQHGIRLCLAQSHFEAPLQPYGCE